MASMSPNSASTKKQNVVGIVENLEKHVMDTAPEQLLELKKIAVKFEEKIFYAATSREDYLRRISVKMISMENKPQSTGDNASNQLAANSSCSNQNPPDSGNNRKDNVPFVMDLMVGSTPGPKPLPSQGAQSQVGNRGKSLSIPVANPSQASQQKPLSHTIHNSMASAGVQSSGNLVSALPSITGLTDNTVPTGVGQSCNLQNLSGVSQNLIGNSVGQCGPSNTFANSQRQMQGRQHMQQVVAQQYQQQSQNPHQYIYQNQFQHPALKKRRGNIPPQLMQSHIQQQQQQQQNLLQPIHLQSSQQSGVQTSSCLLSNQNTLQQAQSSMIQSAAQSGLLQNQQSSSLMPSVLQQHSQSVICQQNDMSSFHQQQLGPQSNISGLKQQQLLGTQTGVSNMQTHQQSMHILQQAKVAAQQTSSVLLSTQGHQPQSSRQQLMSQRQPQSAHFQQQMGLEKQPNSLQRGLIQPQNIIDQQKQLLSQRVHPDPSSTSVDSIPPRGHMSAGDEQEEIYQKVKSMKEKYLPELHEMYKRLSIKCQQVIVCFFSHSPEDIDIYRRNKKHVERMINFLNLSKNSIPQGFKEKLVPTEKHILTFIQSFKRPISSHQQFQLPGDNLSQSQITQLKHNDNQLNPQMQPRNLQSSEPTMNQNASTSIQHGSMPSLSSHMGIPPVLPSMINTLQHGSVLELGQGNALSTLQQGAVGGSIQKSTSNASQQANVNTLSQNIMNALPSNMIHHQHLKQHQEQHLTPTQQMKQHFQRQLMQQQHEQQILKQKHQQLPLLQQQHLQRQQKLPQSAQSLAQQMPQVHHQMSEVSESKVRSSMGVNVISGTFQQHFSAGQHSAYNNHQQLKTGASFHISSPQLLQAASSQISQHSSPQIDQQSMLTSLSKAGTPLQSANSPSISLSPSTPLASSPLPGKPEKQNSGLSSLSNAGNIGQTQTAISSLPQQAQSLAIATPGISASPLLEEFISPDSNLGTASTIVSEKSIATMTPTERLLQAVKSVSRKALSASVNDIGFAISMGDGIAGPRQPGYGPLAAVGEDLVATTKCRLEARNFIPVNGIAVKRASRCYSNENPLNVLPSDENVHDSFETSELESTATSRIKRCRLEINHALLEEISEINKRLINTVVNISDEDVNSMAALGEGVEGTIVKCSFSPRTQDISAQMVSSVNFFATVKLCNLIFGVLNTCSFMVVQSPVLSIRLLISTNYPNCSPILLDKLPVKLSNEYGNLLMKATSKFSTSLRCLSQPMSLGEMARNWDACAFAVVVEYAQQNGGGTFSSRYGTWENCVRAA
ncbi:hypothetical protein BVC80_659g44 [Macleaya cordata]|uniref:Mediator complex subunit 15 KIX domain-containing protein n=1 Tax=Macleaya cordata TaxID=56857 RepID=A0A200QFH6_MACCD|nr:hypothetical protein BVC80_659g44 [Macleaya cordata]